MSRPLREPAPAGPPALTALTAPEPALFRQVAGRTPTAVTVVSTVWEDEPCAMTVNTFISVSLDPLLVLVSLATRCRTMRRIRESGCFGVTVLAADQHEVARHFADSSRPDGAAGFAGRAWRPAPHTGSPVLADGVSYVDCVADQVTEAGDHALVVGRVRAFGLLVDRPPLVFWRSRFTGVGEPA